MLFELFFGLIFLVMEIFYYWQFKAFEKEVRKQLDEVRLEIRQVYLVHSKVEDFNTKAFREMN